MFAEDDNNSIRTRKQSDMWIKKRNDVTSSTPVLVNFIDKINSTDKPKSYVPLGFIKSKTSFRDEKTNEDIEENRYKAFVDALKKYGEEFCSGTSLHGLRYVGMEGVSLFERLFWVLSFIAAVGFSAYFINNVFAKWNLTPVIVGINPKFKAIQSIPFPAVTICNMNQVKKSVAYEILKDEDPTEMLLLDDVCKTNNATEDSTDEGSTTWDIVRKFMLRVSQPCSEMVVYCQWQGSIYPCDYIINPALTDEGVCCTFNKVAGEYMFHHPWQVSDFNITFPPNNIDWTPEGGYPDNITTDTWPFRPEGAGSHLGLTIVADVNANDYYCSSTSSVGLKVRLHSPVESPMVADFGFFLHPRKENRIAITPNVDEATPTIHDIPIEQRQCLFSYERDLFYYRTYTKMNCETECISNYTLQQCNCVPYYLPKNIDTKICGKKKELCYKKAKSDMEISITPEKQCNCLPACYEIDYNAEVSIGDISNAKLRKSYALSTDLNDLIITHFFFSHSQFRSYQKSELFGFTEVLANSGGLLGLFLGFSFLSAVEIGYHLTLKLWCTYYKKHKEHSVYPFTN